jgi:AraC-like DNA-binding protein
MTDPLAQIVGLLQPSAPFWKRVSGSGPWRAHLQHGSSPYYVAVLEGQMRFSDPQGSELLLQAGDFLLMPSAKEFVLSSIVDGDTGKAKRGVVVLPDGECRVGSVDGSVDMRALVGYCAFRSVDATLLSSLLPQVVVVRDERRLALLMELLGEEWRSRKPARDVVLQHLLEVLLIEALRSTAEPNGSPGLLRGLTDERLAQAIRAMHAHPERDWTVATLAREAALSRSGFHQRFQGAVGMAPMEYLSAWRMALAKDLLRDREAGLNEIAKQVGYRSASAFSVAFIRSVGMPPARFAREAASAQVVETPMPLELA